MLEIVEVPLSCGTRLEKATLQEHPSQLPESSQCIGVVLLQIFLVFNFLYREQKSAE